ncbi:unnamed protein product [Amoebophrya sp. A120]|nr:unnamed protein product [Amoebophrya sp. A120]|eukprot:GSA120T00005109001.1
MVLSDEAIEERDVLRSIFGTEFSVENEHEWLISFPDCGSGATALVLHVPPDYPTESPPIAEIACPPPAMDVDFAVDSLPAFSPGESCIYDWACEIRAKLEEVAEIAANPTAFTFSAGSSGVGVNRSTEDEDLAAALAIVQLEDDDIAADGAHDYQEQVSDDVVANAASEISYHEYQKSQNKKQNNKGSASSSKKIEIHHGDPFTERKSTFQGHVADIASESDVKAVLELLYQDGKFARATHNQYAWRYRDEAGNLHADNNDDGEAGAGRKLAELLEVMKAENVLCVVSRWYGGILLGPDRFKCINRAASELLDRLGKRKR